MKFHKLCCNAMLAALLALPVAAQQCTDAGDESHHKVLFENENVRILSLQLGRIESTGIFCYANPALHIGTSEGQTATSSEGGPFISHDWRTGQSIFSGLIKKLVIRNTVATTHTEIVIETKRELPTNLFYNNTNTNASASDGEVFAPETVGSTGTWTSSFSLGSLAGTRARLASGESLDLNRPDHALIALNDVKLEVDGGATIIFSAGTMRVLGIGKEAKLKNMSKDAAEFIVIEL